MNETRTEKTVRTSEEQRVQPNALRSALFLALCCDSPATTPVRMALSGLTRVALGRSDKYSFTRSTTERGSAQLQLADKRVSARHAKLILERDQWWLADDASTNGSLVNEIKVENRRKLVDGDIITLGRTLLLFRSYPQPFSLPQSALSQGPGFDTLNPAYHAELERVSQMAVSPVPILLFGETGTGKEILARAIHARSGRSGRFVSVSGAGFQRENAKAVQSGKSQGLLQDAQDGTLYIDELSDLSAEAQAELLRLLTASGRQGGSTESSAGSAFRDERTHSVRLISASNKNLEQLVEQNDFRKDLYARLAGFVHRIPNFGERREDVALLLSKLLSIPERRGTLLRTDAAFALLSYHWPLNARELDGTLESALILAQNKPIELSHLPAQVTAAQQNRQNADLQHLSLADQALRADLLEILAEENGNLSAVARRMGKARQQIQRWAKRLNIDLERLRS